MSIPALFIDRPVATTLLALAIFLSGVLAYFHLPVAPLPNITFPVVVVQANMAGAAPEIMAATVAEPLEKRMATIAGVTQLTSTSYVGAARIIAQFDVSRDINGASRNVQAAIQAARADLPTTLRGNPTWRQYNPSNSPIMILALTSDTLTKAQLYDSADTVIQQQLSQVAGVGQITLGGGALPSVRIELEPDKLSGYGIGMEDVRAAVSAANADSAKGDIDQGDQRFEVTSNDQATVAADYRDLVIAYRNGAPVLLRDVAQVNDANENIRNVGLYNDKPAVGVIVYPIPGANIVATDAQIRKVLPSVEATLPHGAHVNIAMDRSQSVNAAVGDTERTLTIAVILVITVVFVFLQSVRSTWIPAVALPLSIIGTFGPMYLLGYSIDNLSLMALTIGTGFVVDDAVVVLENIVRHLNSGLSPREAALRGSAEVGFTVISMSLSLIAVFIPILLMPGTVGLVFHEFAVTLSIAILFSMVISLTITPCMCAHVLYIELKPLAERRVSAERIVQRLRPKLNGISGARLFLQAQQDLHIGGRQSAAEYQYTLSGDDANVIYNLVPRLIAELGKHRDQLTDVNTDLQQNGLQAYVTIDRETAARYNLTPNQVDAVLYDAFGQRTVSTIYNPYNQYFVVMEVAPKYWQYPQQLNRIFFSTAAGNVTGTQQTQMPGGTVSGVTTFVSVVAPKAASSSTNTLNANAEANQATNAISNSRGGTSSGSADSTAAETMVPVSALATYVDNHTAIQVNHQSGLIAATISFNLPPGGSLSAAQAAINSAMRDLGAPASIHGNFQGSAQVFAQSLAAIPLLILAALVVVYIVLGILYENTIHPLTILSTLPSAGIGATLALLLFDVPFSMIALIGIILLIGIVKKNAIMMIDVAIHLERYEKRDGKEAIHEAAVIRLRPIMMTTAAAVLGAVPLAIGIGQGASLRQPLGITVMGGLILSQIFTLFTTPVIYLSLDRLRLKLGSVASGLSWRGGRESGSNA